MTLLYAFFIIIILVGILAIFYISIYNKFQYIKTKIEQAEGIIDESLRTKYDLIVQANMIIKSNLDHKDYFKDLEDLKKQNLSTFDFDRKLSENIALVMQLKADYKELQDNKGMKDFFRDLKDVDEKLSAAKSFYNKYTSELNKCIRTFPSNIVAKLHGFGVSPFFDGKDMTDEIIDDFKM